MMKKIKLTRNKFALVDDEDFKWLNNHQWSTKKGVNTFYVQRRHKNKMILMHRIVIQKYEKRYLEDWEAIDHKDHNGLNNQKNNLRICTRSQNEMNKEKQKDCSSQYKGVCWDQNKQKWRTRIQIDKKRKHLGFFDSEIEAAHYYDFFAIQYFKEFKYINFPKIDYENFEPKIIKTKNKTSKLKGVSRYKSSQKWCTRISIKGKTIFLGCFQNEKEAAIAYDKKAKELFGEFAKLNFPEDK